MSAGWDAIIVNYNGALFLDACLKALTNTRTAPDRIIVVDNASEDESLKELAAWPQAELVASHTNLGYSGGANLGIQSSDADLVLVLNPDVEVDPDFGANLLSVFDASPQLGIAGAVLRFPDSGLIQHAGGIVHWPGLTTSHVGERGGPSPESAGPAEADYVTGAAISIRRETWRGIDGFDEAFFPAYWEDVDFCWRARAAGWNVIVHPELSGVHHEGAGETRGAEYYAHWSRNRLRFASRHMSPDDWWGEFVPAEIERLRGELTAADDHGWYTRSGGEAIEIAARMGIEHSRAGGPVARPQTLIDAIEAIRDLPEAADPRPGPQSPSDGVTKRIKRFLSRFSGRLYAEDLYWHQRQFNERLVRAFEAQDRLNREAVVQLLFTLLLVAGGPRQGQPERNRSNVGDHDMG